jgi:serine protease AprX
MLNRLSGLKLSLIAVLVATSALTLRGSSSDHHALLSADLLAHQARQTPLRTRVIVHGTSAEVDALAQRHHLEIVRRLDEGAVLAANSAEITRLASDLGVDHLSGDAIVRNSMAISAKATGANQAWAGTPGLLLGLGGIPAVNGQGVVVAVVDSGISLAHPALARKVVASVSLITNDPSTDDAFGHGTHVAGIIAGLAGPATYVTPLYAGGIAQGASLVNVRVLGADGTGLTSDVIAGINWVVANRAKYHIRVINLSLGHPVTEPSALDPLDQAVANAVNAGLVVVASAGNAGLSADGRPILGGIMSPGNSPLAITVGATNTHGTVQRNDDTVATYSSRGPTRYDFGVKPDIAAPGNKIISLEASGSYLSRNYPALHMAGNAPNAYMQLSGTSMSAPMVSGAAALLLQGNPSLIPAQIKLALQTTAAFMTDGGLMGAGAGNANFWAARQAAASGLGATLGNLLSSLLSSSSGVAFWDSGTMAYRMYGGLGRRLLSLLEAPLVWLNPSLLNSGDLNFLGGLLNPLAQVGSSPLLWGQVSGWTTNQQILWGTTIYNPQGQQILWGTDNTTGDSQILWGTAMTDVNPQ